MTHHSDTVEEPSAGRQSVEERWIEVLTEEYEFANWKAHRIIRTFQANERLRMGSPSPEEVRQYVSSAIEKHGFDEYDQVNDQQSVVDDLQTVLELGLAGELLGPNSHRPARMTDVDLVDGSQSDALVADPALERKAIVSVPGDGREPAEIAVDVRTILRLLVQQHLPESLHVADGTGATIDRDAAISTLIQSNQTSTALDSPDRAEAVIDHFVANGILQEHGPDIVLLADPESVATAASRGTGQDTPILLNWISALEVCVANIRELIDVIADVLDELVREIGQFDLAEMAAEYERKRNAVARELRELTDDGSLDTSELAELDASEGEHHREHLINFEELIELIDESTELDEEIHEIADELSTFIHNLKTTEATLEAYIHRLTQVHSRNASIAHDEATDLATSLAAIADDLARASMVTEQEEPEDDIVAFGEVLLNDVRNLETLGQGARL